TTFAEDLFQSFPRKDQRRWGQSYLRGLLLDGRRKSIQPMAARLARGGPDADADALEQALRQFVNQSPWDPVPVRRRLAERMTPAIGPAAWATGDTGLPQSGRTHGARPRPPGRRERARRHRPGQLPAGLAAVPARGVGRWPPAGPGGARGRRPAAPAPG